MEISWEKWGAIDWPTDSVMVTVKNIWWELFERCLFTNDVKTKELLTSRAYES